VGHKAAAVHAGNPSCDNAFVQPLGEYRLSYSAGRSDRHGGLYSYEVLYCLPHPFAAGSTYGFTNTTTRTLIPLHVH
jgi:hypothetical protein